MKRGVTVIAASALMFLFLACTKDPLKNLSNEESRIYITQRDSTINFTAFKTFSIADSVAYINNNQVVTRFTAGYIPRSAIFRLNTVVASRCANVVAGAGSVRSSAGTYTA